MIREDIRLKRSFENLIDARFLKPCNDCNADCEEYRYRHDIDIDGNHLCMSIVLENVINYILELESKLYSLGQLDIATDGDFVEYDSAPNEANDKGGKSQ